MAEPIAGNLHVANEALADLVAKAATECYGVVGLTSSSAGRGRVRILPESKQKRGVAVREADGGVQVEVFVVIEYGTNIATVSQNLIDAISFAMKELAHVPLAGVQVHVQDIRVKH